MTADSIAAAKRMFEEALAERSFYDRQTADDAHLQAILRFVPVDPGMRILDLGTGNGYLAFAFAAEYPGADVTGLDIAENALERNRQRAQQNHADNLHFAAYDGRRFPFSDGAFDLVVSRYALHHFPEIRQSLSEISRVLTQGGKFFLSDPAPHNSDLSGFADEYMQVKPDGHIRFYSRREWETMCRQQGFSLLAAFSGSIRFPRKNEPAYQEIIRRHGRAVADAYEITVAGDEIYITEQVNNLLFQK